MRWGHLGRWSAPTQPGDVHEADATSSPVDDASFDAAVCVQVLEYVAEPTAGLAEINRALGFEDIRAEAHPFVSFDFDPETYGVALIPVIGAFVAGRNGITDEQAQAWIAEQRQLGERSEFYFASTHLCCRARKPR
jgi:SAM-dependent methyltransferase